MNDILFEVLKGSVVVAIMVLIRYAVPYLKSQIKLSNLDWLYDWAVYSVNAAEQTVLAPHKGEFKKAMVKDFLLRLSKESSLKMSDIQIDNLIEAAVFTMRQEETKNEDH